MTGAAPMDRPFDTFPKLLVENARVCCKLKGEVGFAEPGDLPNDGKVIEVIRDHD